jgi:chromosomal replication initiator protein
MTTCDSQIDLQQAWPLFLEYMKPRLSPTAFGNWLTPIEVASIGQNEITLRIPNVFFKEYLLNTFRKELTLFLPLKASGEPNICFVVEKQERKARQMPSCTMQQELPQESAKSSQEDFSSFEVKLNESYRFETFIEGHSNSFVKSAAFGVASRPGSSYNPLFIHGGVGLGKTHLLHSIGHHIKEHNKKLKVQCITTEGFINQLVDALRSKSVDRMKRFYRSNIDVLLVDDIQFLQNRQNFEEEFCNTFETLINSSKQIVITCDKPPSQLKLSERMIARMEWGLVAHVGLPDLETRVAILQHKSEQRGLHIPSPVAFLIAEHIHQNIRQLEGALNRLSAHARLMNHPITEELVEKTLRDMFQLAPREKISIDNILKSVATVFQVKASDLKSATRTKEIALPRQVAMFLAKELINESLVMIGEFFGRTHSTVLHACKSIEKEVHENETLRKQIEMVKRSLKS